MKMQYTLIMCLGDLLRKQDTAGQVLGDLTCDQITLCGSNRGVLIGILLHNVLVAVLDQTENGLVGGIGLTNQFTCIAINDVGFCQDILPVLHQFLLDDILDVFHQDPLSLFVLNTLDDLLDLGVRHLLLGLHFSICLLDSNYDLATVKINDMTIPFHYLHPKSLLYQSLNRLL